MKIIKHVDIGEVEVEIEIGAEDIADAIAEDPSKVNTAKLGISNAHRFLKAIPDSVIAEMTPEARATIANALTEQVKRFS